MLNHLEMERYIAAIARRADLTVHWENAEHPRTNGKVVYLPRMRDNITDQQYKYLRHYATHESDHVLYSDFDILQETRCGPGDSLLGAIWNGLEDHRIEWLGGKEYEGDRLCSNDVVAGLMNKIAKDLPAQDTQIQDSFGPILTFLNKTTTDYYPSLFPIQHTFESGLSKKGKEFWEKLDGGDYADELRRIRSNPDPKSGTKATLELAKRIYEEVYGGDAEKELERCKNPPPPPKANAGGKEKSEGKAKAGEGEGKQAEAVKIEKIKKAEGEGDGKKGEHDLDARDAQIEEGEGKPSPKKKKEDEEEGDVNLPYIHIKYTDVMPDAHEPGKREGYAVKLDYTDYVPSSTGYRPATAQEHSITDYTRGGNAKATGGRYSEVINNRLKLASAGFAHKVRSVLQIRDKDKYEYGTKRGKLHNSALHRLMVPDAPGYSDRIFKKKHVNDVLDAAVCLLVDQSGSMSAYDKYENAAAAAIMLSETIGNVLHIPTEILSFTSEHLSTCHEGEGVFMYIHRKYGDRLLDKQTLLNSFSSSASRGMSNNLDGESIMFAFDRLMQRKEKRKLLVVFSDGSPAGHGRGNIVTYTDRVIKRIENESPVSIVGIGLNDRNVERFYKEHYVINDTRHLEKALLSVIENKLK